jgi:2-polyprenyl-3-methyl-5-hydroxy-6-metoxy-1,4-benzoquinol methylase
MKATPKTSEEAVWAKTKAMLKTAPVHLGDYFSYQIRNTPRRLLFSLSYYKFAAKMIRDNSAVLELGCGEGLGGCILAERASDYCGVDLDAEMVASAHQNFGDGKRRFLTTNFLGHTFGEFDAVASFDVIEHIQPDNDDAFWQTICSNLKPRGVAVVGTPNITSQQYASAVTRSGHINLYDYTRMVSQASRFFDYSFLFSANDELVHTGFSPMAHYLIVLACGPKAAGVPSGRSASK